MSPTVSGTGVAKERGRIRAVLSSPLGAFAALMLSLLVTMAIIGPIVWGDEANTIDTLIRNQSPSSDHFLGTDNLGRDILARVTVATGTSMKYAIVATLIGVLAGLVLGSAPWLLGRRLGGIAVATINIAISFPYLLIALFVSIVFGAGILGATLAVGIAFSPWFARLTHTLISGVRSKEFIASAMISGVSRPRILVKHLLPNIGEPLIINATIAAGSSLLAFAGLSFLGLGVQQPSYDWGVLLSEGLTSIYVSPAAALAPGLAIVVAGLAINLTGEAMAKALAGRTARVERGSGYRSTAIGEVTSAGKQSRANVSDEVLGVEGLVVRVSGKQGRHDAVRGVNLSIKRGEAVGIVGESGSGKSLTALALARLLEPPLEVVADRMELADTDLLPRVDGPVARHLGTKLGIVFQDPMSSLNPTMRIGTQLAEGVRKHQKLSRRAANVRAIDRLRSVHIKDPERRAHSFPHEYSGGMRQRAMIAMAMMGEPALLIADEPTTGLDVTVQKRVLEILHELRRTKGVALLLISHDLAVVRQVCDRVLVMYGGKIVEELPASRLAEDACHPYTRLLLGSVPSLTTPRDQPLATIKGNPLDPSKLGAACPFAPRCPLATDKCEEQPPLLQVRDVQAVACWHHEKRLPGEVTAESAELQSVVTSPISKPV